MGGLLESRSDLSGEVVRVLLAVVRDCPMLQLVLAEGVEGAEQHLMGNTTIKNEGWCDVIKPKPVDPQITIHIHNQYDSL